MHGLTGREPSVCPDDGADQQLREHHIVTGPVQTCPAGELLLVGEVYVFPHAVGWRNRVGVGIILVVCMEQEWKPLTGSKAHECTIAKTRRATQHM